MSSYIQYYTQLTVPLHCFKAIATPTPHTHQDVGDIGNCAGWGKQLSRLHAGSAVVRQWGPWWGWRLV